MIVLTILLLAKGILSGSQIDIKECTPDQQKNIFLDLPECSPRSSLIDLREMFANATDVIEVVPDHVAVDRCGGSCHAPSHTCNPDSVISESIPVMLVLSNFDHGKHEVLCSTVQLDVHQTCRCGCHVKEHQCHPQLHYYHRPTCR